MNWYYPKVFSQGKTFSFSDDTSSPCLYKNKHEHKLTQTHILYDSNEIPFAMISERDSYFLFLEIL